MGNEPKPNNPTTKYLISKTDKSKQKIDDKGKVGMVATVLIPWMGMWEPYANNTELEVGVKEDIISRFSIMGSVAPDSINIRQDIGVHI